MACKAHENKTLCQLRKQNSQISNWCPKSAELGPALVDQKRQHKDTNHS